MVEMSITKDVLHDIDGVHGTNGFSSRRIGDNYMTVAEARILACQIHDEQRDRDGSYHIQHVARVAEGCDHRYPSYQRVAWLHDTVEDGELDIYNLNLPEEEKRALELLTRGDETYAEYIHEIAVESGLSGGIARAVKRADLKDNIQRCLNSRVKNGKYSLDRYSKALVTIERGE